MARIRSVKEPAATRVVVAGRLRAVDMRRLEHACAPALTSQRARLIIDLERVTDIDGTAEAHLRHIAARGALIKRPH